jgi:hypothetical protein
MAEWEYYKSEDDAELDALGRAGWELVAVLPGHGEGAAVFYFKRPAPDFREQVTLDQKRHYYNLLGIRSSAEGESKVG